MIGVDGLRKRFGEAIAVSDATFRADDGLVTGLLGPNGAGKTTTLRMLYGLYRPDAGQVTIDQIPVGPRAESVLGRLGVLPDVTGLYSRLTTREHLEYAARLHGLAGEALERATARAIERFDLGQLAERPSEGFSHGERRSVSLAQALIHDPPNVVLDEPTNGLDVLAIRRLRKTLRELADEGKCVLFSSHVMQEVSAVCDRVVVMARGRVVAIGSPDELSERTGTNDLEAAFVALIGSEKGLN